METNAFAVIYVQGITLGAETRLVLLRPSLEAALGAAREIAVDLPEFEPDSDEVSIFDLSIPEDRRENLLDPRLLEDWKDDARDIREMEGGLDAGLDLVPDVIPEPGKPEELKEADFEATEMKRDRYTVYFLQGRDGTTTLVTALSRTTWDEALNVAKRFVLSPEFKIDTYGVEILDLCDPDGGRKNILPKHLLETWKSWRKDVPQPVVAAAPESKSTEPDEKTVDFEVTDP